MDRNRTTEQTAAIWRLWCIFFLYAASVAVAIQFLILPYLFPAWHAGDGLLKGGDWLTFHTLAVDLAQKISTQGWTAWTLRPDEQAPSGIAAAVYALGIPKPWTLIPLNAALHATAAILLLRIMQIFLKPWRQAGWTVLPFLLYPSATMWYAQIHKDGYAICGFFAFLYGFILFFKSTDHAPLLPRILRSLGFIVFGLFLVWIVRPHWVAMIQALGLVAALPLTIVALVSSRGKSPLLLAAGAALLLLILIPYQGVSVEQVPPTADTTTIATAAKQQEPDFYPAWKPTRALPQMIERKFYTLSYVRNKYFILHPAAKSCMDKETSFHNASEVVLYLPRATQIAFLSPFPTQWFAEGSQPANTLMRRVAGFEMVGVYLVFPFLFYAMWQWRKDPALWIILWFCASMMVLHALTIPNVGSLYRVRYGLLMPLVALGIAGFVTLGQKFRQRFNATHYGTP